MVMCATMYSQFLFVLCDLCSAMHFCVLYFLSQYETDLAVQAKPKDLEARHYLSKAEGESIPFEKTK